MTQSNPNGTGTNMKEAKLPRRDWFLLPLISLLTICFILVSTESIARRTFYATGGVGRYCMFKDPSKGYRGIPNAVCTEKNPETPLIEYRFNSCGDRAGMECGPKPMGVYRIVMAGSSTPMGYGVSRDQSFAAMLPAELSTMTGRTIEVYNESLVKGSPQSISLAFNRLPASKPDLILWVLTPLDIKGELGLAQDRTPGNAAGKEATAHSQPVGLLERVRNRIQQTIARGSISDEILDIWNTHPISSMTEHYLYESQSLYLKSFLMGPEAEFLKAEPDADWKRHLRQSGSVAEDVEERARDAGTPLAAVLIPDRAQAAMISMGEWPADYDPYKLDRDLRAIITRHGGTYIDILPDFHNIPNPEEGYYPVDDHPNAEGHAIIANLLARELTSGVIPELKAAVQPRPPQEQGR
jgi:hypothetical protein